MTPAMFRFVDALVVHGPMTIDQIAEKAFVSRHTAKNHCAPVLARNGMIYQSGWAPYRFGHVPVYSAGVGKTPPRPDGKPRAEYCREWRERTGYSSAMKARRRLRRPPDRALAALLGMTA